MIDIKEVRVGNWVTHKNKEGFYEIVSVDGHNGRVILKGVTQHAYQPVRFINPIPLTTEILEAKCGFTLEKVRYGIVYNNSDGRMITFYLMDNINGFWAILEAQQQVRVGINLLTIKYLHELQNLYFALAQTELEIQQL